MNDVTRYADMKDSGVEWIGKIPSHWKVARLKDVASIFRGGSPRPIEEYLTSDDSGLNWIKIGDTVKGHKYIDTVRQKIRQEGLSKTRLVYKGDLILTNSMSFGDPYILNIDGCIHDGWVCLHNINIEKEFLYYVLVSDLCKYQFDIQVSGGVVKNLNVDKIGMVYIFIPSDKEQRKITYYLDGQCAKIDDIIAGARTSIEEYKKWKASVIYEAVTKGLDPHAEMKDSRVEWIGKIPKHWRICTLKYLCSMQAGKNLTSEQTTDSGAFPVYGGNGLRGFFSEYNTDGNVLLIGRQGALCGNVHRVNGKIWATEHAVITKNSTLIDFNFLYYLLISMDLNQYSSSAAQPGIAVSVISNIKSVLPSFIEQKKIAKYIDSQCSEIDQLISEREALITDLESYKKSLIYEVVTGKRKVI